MNVGLCNFFDISILRESFTFLWKHTFTMAMACLGLARPGCCYDDWFISSSGGHFMKLVITDNLSFTDKYSDILDFDWLWSTVTDCCHGHSQWMTNCQWWQVSWNAPQNLVATLRCHQECNSWMNSSPSLGFTQFLLYSYFLPSQLSRTEVEDDYTYQYVRFKTTVSHTASSTSAAQQVSFYNSIDGLKMDLNSVVPNPNTHADKLTLTDSSYRYSPGTLQGIVWFSCGSHLSCDLSI